MSKSIEEILAPKPEARPRIYTYSIDDQAHAGLLKVGQTTRAVKSLSENPGARLCRPRPAAASHDLSKPGSDLTMLRLVCDTAALHFQTDSQRRVAGQLKTAGKR